MLKKTYTLGLLAVATLGCIFTPSAQASQVEINKQTANQNAAAIGHGNTVYQSLDQSSYQNQLQIPGSRYYYPQPGKPQLQISDQVADQNGAAAGSSNVVIQDLNQGGYQIQSSF